MKQAASYTRKSSSRSQKQINSHRMQQEEIDHYAERNGFKLVKQFSDSSTGLNTDRDGWRAFIAFLEQSKDHYGILYRCDRAARTLSVFAEIEKLMPQLRVVQLGPNEPCLTTVSIMFAIGRAESEANSQRTKSAYRSIKKRNPDHPWGNPNIDAAGKVGRLEAKQRAHRHWGPILDKDLRLLKMGYTHIDERIAELNELGYKTRRGNVLTKQAITRAHKMLGSVSAHRMLMAEWERVK